ncbi:MAG: hypothetical protein FWE92_00050 [Defluviitaleaceae bacterium]|nr:hypothetical protein [Defluviitaleaceae bacterium]
MILRNKLHETCKHSKRTGADAYGDAIFADATEISCRREDTRRLVLDQHGREVVSTARYFVRDKVEPGDTLDNRIVLSVTALTGMFGSTEGFEVSCS